MAVSQMTAPATSGRYMSALAKSVSPALKLMNVLTTATDASEIPVAAGCPDRGRGLMSAGRTAGWIEPPLPWPLRRVPMLHCYLSLSYLQPQLHQGEDMPR